MNENEEFRKMLRTIQVSIREYEAARQSPTYTASQIEHAAQKFLKRATVSGGSE